MFVIDYGCLHQVVYDWKDVWFGGNVQVDRLAKVQTFLHKVSGHTLGNQ